MMSQFSIISRKTKYGKHLVVCPSDQPCTVNDRFTSQQTLAKYKAANMLEAATKYAKRMTKGVEGPLNVHIQENTEAGNEVHFIVVQTFQDAIYTYTPTHNPSHGSYGMSARGSYYAGRGPNRGDCGPDHLVRLYKGIKRDFGDEAAEELCRTVEQMGELSATAFLNEFESYWNNGRKTRIINASGVEISSPSDSQAAQVEGMCAIFSAMGDRRSSNTKNWESDGIKVEFFGKVGYKPKDRKLQCFDPYTGRYGVVMDALGEMIEFRQY